MRISPSLAGLLGMMVGVRALAAGVPATRLESSFGSGRFLVRRAGDPDSGIDSAVAWAVRPFPRPALSAMVRASIRRLVVASGRVGIQPTEQWPG